MKYSRVNWSKIDVGWLRSFYKYDYENKVLSRSDTKPLVVRVSRPNSNSSGSRLQYKDKKTISAGIVVGLFEIGQMKFNWFAIKNKNDIRNISFDNFNFSFEYPSITVSSISEISLSDLKSNFYYDQNGNLYKKFNKDNYLIKNLDSDGYITLGFMGRMLKAHRVIAVMAGILDTLDSNSEIDHINGIRDDNRPSNLRAVSCAENSRNLALSKRNTTGIIGVFPCKSKFCAQIKVNNEVIHLGTFGTINEAFLARKEAEKVYNFHENHGRIKKQEEL